MTADVGYFPARRAKKNDPIIALRHDESVTIFQNPQAKSKLIEWHHRFKQKIPAPTESRQIATGLGETHVLLCGPTDAPPVVCVHGALSSSAHVLSEGHVLAQRYRMIAPDVPGQSPMSAEVRPDLNGPAYGEWFSDVLDGLGLSDAYVLAASLGGVIALRAATHVPKRIRKMSLVVPAGIVNGSALPAFFKMGWPMMMYRASPSRPKLERVLRHVTTTYDEDWFAYLGDAFVGFKLDFRLPRNLQPGDLGSFSAPVQVFGAELDLQFPGKPLLERAKAVIPSLAETVLIPGSRHTPPFDDKFRGWLADQVGRFLMA